MKKPTDKTEATRAESTGDDVTGADTAKDKTAPGEATPGARTKPVRKQAAAPGTLGSSEIGQGKAAQAGQPGELRPAGSSLVGDGSEGRPAAPRKPQKDIATPADNAPHTAPTATAQPVSAPPRGQQTGFWPVVLGGVVAAGLGAGATILALPHLPPEWLPAEAAADRQTVIDEAVAAAREAVANQPAPPATLPEGLAARLDALEQAQGSASELAELGQRIDALDARIGSLPQGDVPADAAERIEAAAAEAEARLQAARDEAQALQEAAAQTTRRAEAVAAIAALQSALDQGVSAADAQTALEGAGIAPPDALQRDIPSLAALQDGFPDAARAALRADLSGRSASGEGNALTNFLRAQTGARSVAPRAGDDTDAILSRAEAALNGGDLAAALTELQALPPGAAEAPAMAEWLARAETHSAAQSALSDLSSSQD